MKNQKTKRFVILILIIVVVIATIIMVKNSRSKKIKRLDNLYKELETSQTYLLEWEQNDDNKTIMAQKGDKTIIDQYLKNSHTTTIVKDNNTYLVLHDREEYYVYENNNIEQSILTDGLKEITSKEFKTGKEKINGKNFLYEEYEGSTMFMISNSLNEEDIKTRFYFDNENNLKYIRTIKGATQELLKIRLEKEVADSIFEIPSNYAENKY